MLLGQDKESQSIHLLNSWHYLSCCLYLEVAKCVCLQNYTVWEFWSFSVFYWAKQRYKCRSWDNLPVLLMPRLLNFGPTHVALVGTNISSNLSEACLGVKLVTWTYILFSYMHWIKKKSVTEPCCICHKSFTEFTVMQESRHSKLVKCSLILRLDDSS